MYQNKKLLVYFVLFVLVGLFGIMMFMPTHQVSATGGTPQTPADCAKCHSQADTLWEASRHKEGNVNCLVCHKLADSGGQHPDSSKYTVEPEEATCLVCHTEVAGENIAGQLAVSQHGQVGLTCISCHEQHSQGLKLSDGSRTVCENCHKKETRSMLESTHFAAGLSCVNCHMGEKRNHTLVVAVQTCDQCHTDLHDARRMLDAGLEVKPMDTPAAMAPVTVEPEAAEEHPAAVKGGVTMPSWTLVFSGMLIGAVIAWALVGKDPGKPSAGK